MRTPSLYLKYEATKSLVVMNRKFKKQTKEHSRLGVLLVLSFVPRCFLLWIVVTFLGFGFCYSVVSLF